MKRIKWWVLFIVLLVAGGIAAGVWWFKSSSYTYVSPRKGDMVEAIYGLGKVKPRRKYEVKLAVMSSVEKLFVHEGDQVKANDPLIQFTNTGVFRAPFAGMVTLVAHQESETVLPHVEVLRLQEMDKLYLEVSLEQEGALRVTKDQQTLVAFESIRGEKFVGKVVALYPKEEEFLAHIEVENLPENVLPGMTADTSIIVRKRQDVLMVPLSSIMNGQILLRRDGKKMKIPVKVGGVDGQWAEIVEGDIKLDDQILIKKDKQ